MKTLIVVDMQNDFIDGSLANTVAQSIVEPMSKYIQEFDGNIIFTRDTHDMDYLNTPEGKKLPVKHCIEETSGWCVNTKLIEAAYNNIYHSKFTYNDKTTFGTLDWQDRHESIGDEIIMCGTCTDICVISNALILKAMYPDKQITVLKDLCAGLTSEKHEAALEVMKSCQIEVI